MIILDGDGCHGIKGSLSYSAMDPHRPTTMMKICNGLEWKSASTTSWRMRTKRAGISWRKIRQSLSRYSPFRSFGSRPFYFMAAQLVSWSSTKMVGGDSMAPPVCGGGPGLLCCLRGLRPSCLERGGAVAHLLRIVLSCLVLSC